MILKPQDLGVRILYWLKGHGDPIRLPETYPNVAAPAVEHSHDLTPDQSKVTECVAAFEFHALVLALTNRDLRIH